MSDDSTKDDGLSEDGFSSEDLLRDAKEKFGLDDGSSGVAESLLESSMGVDESAEPVPSVDEIAAELAASRAEDTDFSMTPDTDFAMTPDTDFEVAEDTDFTPGGTEDLLQHSADDPAEPVDRPPTASRVTREEVTAARHDSLEPDSIQFTLPDPGVATGLPSEPVDVDSDQMIAGLPIPAQSSAKAGGLLSLLWRNRWIVVVAIIGISVLGGILDQSEPISNVGVGDCFNDPGDSGTEVNVLDCAGEHAFEVYASFVLSGGAFPGSFAVLEQAESSCIDHFVDYVGNRPEASILEFVVFPRPDQESWDEGDRRAGCIVYEPVPGSDGIAVRSRTGSVRGSGL